MLTPSHLVHPHWMNQNQPFDNRWLAEQCRTTLCTEAPLHRLSTRGFGIFVRGHEFFSFRHHDLLQHISKSIQPIK